jgi:tRNA (guanine-N(7)-)-methyltransferase
MHGTPRFALLARLSVAQCAGAAPVVAGCGTIEVDVGCGKGRFLLARAAAHRETAFLGIERQAGRIRRVARQVEKAGLTNVRLLQLDASYVIEQLLPPGSVSVYYVFFPDPWPKRRHHTHRLLDRTFMDHAWRTLAPGGRIHAATDDEPYFRQIAASMTGDTRFAATSPFVPDESEKTDFERLFAAQGKPILRCSVAKRG